MVFNQKSNMTNFLKANIETQRAFTVSLCSVSPLVKSNKTNTPTSGLLKRVRKYYLHLSDTSKSIQVNFVCLSLSAQKKLYGKLLHQYIYIYASTWTYSLRWLWLTDWLDGTWTPIQCHGSGWWQWVTDAEDTKSESHHSASNSSRRRKVGQRVRKWDTTG